MIRQRPLPVQELRQMFEDEFETLQINFAS